VYDEVLHAFICDRESVLRSQHQVWQNNLLSSFVAFMIFLSGANFAGEQIKTLMEKLFPWLEIAGTPVGFSLFTWSIFVIELAFVVYGTSRMIYYSDFADSVSSKFAPDRSDLVKQSYLSGGPSPHYRTDLRRQLYASYEHILVKQFLKREYTARRHNSLTHRGLRFLWSLVLSLFVSMWISINPRPEVIRPWDTAKASSETCEKYHYRALWPLALGRSMCVGVLWASTGAWFVALRTSLRDLAPVFVVAAVLSLTIYSCQFAFYWWRTGRLSVVSEAEAKRSQGSLLRNTCGNDG